MRPTLESLRRLSNPDLQDDVFARIDAAMNDDWRSVVPGDVRKNWLAMSLGERFGVSVLARSILAERTPADIGAT